MSKSGLAEGKTVVFFLFFPCCPLLFSLKDIFQCKIKGVFSDPKTSEVRPENLKFETNLSFFDQQKREIQPEYSEFWPEKRDFGQNLKIYFLCYWGLLAHPLLTCQPGTS